MSGYISKKLLLKAYKTLSNLTFDHKQGQTQIVSAIRHLLALDMYYRKNYKNCNLNISENRDIFVNNVKFIVNIIGDYYTTNFYKKLKPLQDCGVGSNFFSAGVVNNSKQNNTLEYDYPTRGQYPLFKVKDNELIREVSYFKNLRKYLNHDELKCAFILWFLRNQQIDALNYNVIEEKLCDFLSLDLVKEIMPEYDSMANYVIEDNLENKKTIIEIEDILDLFNQGDNENKHENKKKYHFHLTAIKSKPFLLLAGISGTGKSRIVREFAFKSCPKYLQDKNETTPGNYCMIEVKPNWHDSTELLGYYSRLGEAGYQFTKFAKFLVKAKMFPNVPFFVCLDEMNLAPVEQYFAEILSILETRKHPKNTETGEVNMDTVKTEAIIDARFFRELSELSTAKNTQTGETFKNKLTDRDIYLKLFGIDTEENIDEKVGKRHDLTTEGLTLPDNVIIIGTVNMDDTTHQFSRKVIDRAMTIEMNGGNLRSMFGGSRDLEYLKDEEQKKWQNAFTRRYVTADEVLEAYSEVADKLMNELPSRLETINNALKGTPFEVSYRVLNEFTIMVGVMLDENRDMELNDIINQALNYILLMKILPRIEGDAEMFALSRDYKEKMGITYNNRLEWLKEQAPDIQEVSTEETPEDEDNTISSEENKEHQQTAKEKIQEMIDRLNNQEYTRFWP